ncbi:uncharacterized protein [Amphiura filiformis]|uniref:uncharacterized protein n=1 Tax=Amphiura filiformis TaxID=82378 RepID=UPI003B223B50
MERIATWNVSGLGDKEPELVETMERYRINIMGISDTRRKEYGMKEIHNNYVLIWSGVEKNKRAKHGVGFVLHPEVAKNITETEYISERIMKLQIRQDGKNTTYIQIYAPCNDSYTDEEKDDFYDQLSDIIQGVNLDDNLLVMGDFTGRVGNQRTPWEAHLGPHSDHNTNRNYNGQLTLELCAQHGLFITNTFFQHRKSQIYTWYRWNDLEQASQIDFILARKSHQRHVIDSKAMPNIQVDTDHRPVMLETRAPHQIRNRKLKPVTTTINWKKLREEDTCQEIELEMAQKMCDNLSDRKGTAEEEWNLFKTSLTDTLKAKCGIKKAGKGDKKGTAWWNDTVKEAIKVKKKLFKQWSRTKSQSDYDKYKAARKECKKVVKTAKNASWQEYGENLAEKCEKSPREFYKAVKAVRQRDEPFDPTSLINDEAGNPLTDQEDINNRWEEYFDGLLNFRGSQRSQEPFNPGFPDEEEPSILEDEVRAVVKESAKNKAAGTDDITTEAIQACGDVGIKWLTRVFNAAWEERAAPDDWQRR